MIDDTSLNNNQPVDNSSEGVTPAVTDPQTPQPVADFPVQPVPSAVPVPPVITASTSFDNSPLPPENNSPTVAVSDQAGNVPKWFYLIFGVTLIIFFVVTGLLIMSFVQQPNKETGKVIPNIIPTETTGNITLVPTLTPTPTPLACINTLLTDVPEESSLI